MANFAPWIKRKKSEKYYQSNTTASFVPSMKR